MNPRRSCSELEVSSEYRVPANPNNQNNAASDVSQLIHNCRLRLPRRSTPPNWSETDWQYELAQNIAFAVIRIIHNFVPSREEALEPFVLRQVDSEIRNIHRREWSFGRRVSPTSPSLLSDGSPSGKRLWSGTHLMDSSVNPAPFYDELYQALSNLPESQRQTLVLLFFEGTSEVNAAQKLGTTQQTVSRLKRAALNRMAVYLSR